MDIYNMEKIEKILNIGRNKMIALALLCGCDYSEGVSGVGKEAALKFFKTVEEADVLQRFDIYCMFLLNLSNFVTTGKFYFSFFFFYRIQGWRTDTGLDVIESDMLNSKLCIACGHPGKLQKHTKSGCPDCGTIRKCNDDFR